MKLFVWKTPSFLAVAHAHSVSRAREVLLLEIGESGDGSCPERDEARRRIKTETPGGMWVNTNAEFALTDSAELREMDEHCQRQEKQIAALRAENARLRDILHRLAGEEASDAR